LEKAWNERLDDHSGEWILNHAAFQEWTDMTSIEHSTLYFNAILGTGTLYQAMYRG
jgi:hypothetical protein